MIIKIIMCKKWEVCSFWTIWFCWTGNKCSNFLLKGEWWLRVICTTILWEGEYIMYRNQNFFSKCSSKPEFNVSRLPLPFLVILHHWRWPCSLHNPKCHLSPGYPCMKQCHCSHKGMDIGINCVVIHFRVCKKFFQVLSPMSSAHHPVVPFENLLPLHLSCLNMLECCLRNGQYLSWSISSATLVR